MISDNNHINYTAADIQRYWNGQLTPQEMHALEKAAMDDPFLADALEGMGDAIREHGQQPVNAELENARQQLQARTQTEPRKGKVRTFRWWQAAAAAMILVIGGYWIFSNKGEINNMAPVVVENKTSTEAKTDSAPAPASTTDKMAATSAPTDSIEITAGVSAFKIPGKKGGKDSFGNAGERATDRFQTPVQTYGSTLRLDSIQPGAIVQNSRISIKDTELARKPEVASRDFLQVYQKRDSDRLFLNRPVTANAFKSDTTKYETEVVHIQGETFAKATEKKQAYDTELKLQNVIKGVVTDNKNNPLANALIQLPDKNAYVTDQKGYFKIPVQDSVVNVSIGLVGYNTQNFRLKSNNENGGRIFDNQVQLQPGNAGLSEVVVVGYGSQKRKALTGQVDDVKSNAITQDAQPVYGWLSYEQYVEKNKRVPAKNSQLAGEVVLSFQVNKKGELSDFKIEKSLSPQHDAEAQRLVREGPAWKVNKGRKSRVTVIVRF